MEWKLSPPDGSGFETISLRGDCDLYATPALEMALRARLTAGVKRLRIDLEEVEYLDSSGVGALIRTLQAAKAAGCELRFRGIGGSPRQVLKMTNVLALMKEDSK
jgi:anti-sigma B factor antagonist